MKDTSILISNGVNLSKSLETFGDMQTYDECLNDFKIEVNEKIEKIAQFKANNDMENYAILVHSLKSDARCFGFVALGELAYSHEMASKENNVNFVSEHYNELIDETNKVLAIVNQYLN